MNTTLWIIKELTKLVPIRLARILLRGLYVLPIKDDRVIFYSFNGKQYSCNPRAITEYLLKEHPDMYEIIWAFADPDKFREIVPADVKVIKYGSFKRLLLQATSRVCVNNTGTYSWFPVRKGQLHVNTWHAGGAYKRLQSDRFADYNRRLTSRETTHMLSSCALFTRYMLEEQMGFAGTVIAKGLPRNDVFFDKDAMAKRDAYVRKLYGIDPEASIVLFAPTWRYNGSVPVPDFEQVKEAIKKRFGHDVCVMVRNHHYAQNSYEGFVDVSDYFDMQDLLCAADVLITDYSSCIWDFALTQKPCFLYMEDFEDYDTVQGFFTDPMSWGFPISKSTPELVDAIEAFDQREHELNMAEHLKMFGSYETGHAARDVCEVLFGLSSEAR